MTEQLFPDDMANGLVDGTIPAEAVPADLQATASLLRAAHQPASSEELSGMAAMVQAFTAEVAAATPSTTSRSTPMFATRFTRRATAMVAVTFLAAGTAAAAAGGVLPTPFSGASHIETVDTVIGSDTVTGDTTDSTGVDTTGVDTTGVDSTDVATTGVDSTEVATTGVDSTEVDSTDVVDSRGNGHEFKGLCTAWTNGAPKNANNPSFSRLKTAADAAGQTIDEFCVTVLAADHSGDDQGDDQTDGTEPADDSGQHGNNGNGNGGNGNGNGNGNSGNHGGAPSTSTPGEGHGSGNSDGHGGGNSGGHGNG